MSCKNCMHNEVCDALYQQNNIAKLHPVQCEYFKDEDIITKILCGASSAKRARWVEESDLYVYCSNCGTMEHTGSEIFKSDYCPNCGAKMDLEW